MLELGGGGIMPFIGGGGGGVNPELTFNTGLSPSIFTLFTSILRTSVYTSTLLLILTISTLKTSTCIDNSLPKTVPLNVFYCMRL